MTTTLDTALSRLRNADPAAATPVDALETDADQLALLTEILDSPDDRSSAQPDHARRRRMPRLALAGAVVAAVAATAIAGVIPVPWWHGQAPSAAYAVTKNPDGTVDVTVRWNQLHDPDALSARLRQAGVRAAVMLYSAPRQCRATVALDPTYSTLHVALRLHPELAKHPRALVAYLRSQEPWIQYDRQRSGDPDHVSVFTIHPDAIPSGDQLLVLPRWLRMEGAPTEALELRSLIVRALPQCVPNPSTSIMTRNAIEPR
jgi:hypothetical protein